MQLSQLTIAVMAGSNLPRQWPLLSVHRPMIFGLGMIAGAMAVAVTRGWLRWRRPRRAGQPVRAGVADPANRAARVVRQVAQPVSAPVSTVLPAGPPVVAAAGSSAAASALIWPPRSQPGQRVRRSAGPWPDQHRSEGPRPTEESCDPAPELVAAARALLARLEALKVTLISGPPELVDRLLTTAAAELSGQPGPDKPCDLVLAGFQQAFSANGQTVRCADLSAALDVIAARAVVARRGLDNGLSVLVSRVAAAPSELSMLTDLVNEPGRVAALLRAGDDGPPPAAAAVFELSRGAGPHERLLTSVRSGRAGDPDQPAASGLRIGVLGQLTINGQPGALLPAQTQLIVALALQGEDGLHNKQLCRLLGSDADHRKPADSLRQLIARTRRQLGPTADGGEWIEHLGHGRYALHKDARLDWHEFEALTDQGIEAEDASQLTAALAMIRGQPFTGCYYWWLDIELVEAVGAKIVAAASMLAELALGQREPTVAARAARIGLVADATSEQLWRLLMRSEHAAGNLAGVREAWSRCAEAVAEIAVDGQPERETATLYRQLLGR
jgi:DNA-binding SARP family transcriptional activator